MRCGTLTPRFEPAPAGPGLPGSALVAGYRPGLAGPGAAILLGVVGGQVGAVVGRDPAGREVVVVIDPAGAAGPVRAECARRVAASRRVRVELGPGPGPGPGSGPESGPDLEPAASGFWLELPGYAGLGRRSLARLLDHARDHPVGLISVVLPGATHPATAVRLWRAAARQEVHRRRRPEESLAAAAGRLTGHRWEAASRFGIVDLRRPPVPPVPPLKRIGDWARDRLPARWYGWLAFRVKDARRRVRNYLFLD
jgi:hypothetical protein